MSKGQTEALVQEQIAYCRARAGEYDEWFLRQGRYDRGPELNRQWFEEVVEVEAALAAFAPTGRVLELAGGTGLWTQRLLPFAEEVTVVDASAEALALSRVRLGEAPIRFVEANVFDWHPEGAYDAVFFSFWLSHVPPERFEAFWQLVRSCLAPQGRVFFLDSLYEPASTATDHWLADPGASTTKRRLNDGREFEIIKVFYPPERLAVRLAMLGWRATVRATTRFFLYGAVSKNNYVNT
ncbi:MAG: class I SAM-dependent methyltransferase [Armatimonadetes bacterium]|nr:class I SAM-dependent methyltransferase [Armatimonadota bacterium]